MIRSVRSYKILEGVRGKKRADIESLQHGIQRLSQLLMQYPEIQELDINPLMVFDKGEGVKIADGRIRIEKDGIK
jgi:succinyl-CoA synthetase beta subunit